MITFLFNTKLGTWFYDRLIYALAVISEPHLEKYLFFKILFAFILSVILPYGFVKSFLVSRENRLSVIEKYKRESGYYDV